MKNTRLIMLLMVVITICAYCVIFFDDNIPSESYPQEAIGFKMDTIGMTAADFMTAHKDCRVKIFGDSWPYNNLCPTTNSAIAGCVSSNQISPVTYNWPITDLSGDEERRILSHAYISARSMWGQEWPYNSMSPVDPSGPGGHVWAGCVSSNSLSPDYAGLKSDWHLASLSSEISSIIRQTDLSLRAMWSGAIDTKRITAEEFIDQHYVSNESGDNDIVACYIQKNYCPINSVIMDIYRDRLLRN